MSINNIFSVIPESITALAADVFRFQYENNQVYQDWCKIIGTETFEKTNAIQHIPFLPIGLFKSHEIVSTTFTPEAIFESSGTTKTINSKHLVKDISIYRESFTKAFSMFYGNIEEWCIIGLLPSYLERNNSSLVMMVNELIKACKHPNSGFYLHNFEALHKTLTTLEQQKQKTLLIGVTFALLDFAEQFPISLQHTTIMETGGMKGRKQEMTREEVHAALSKGLGVDAIHSEYGMTELMSQAYSIGNGLFVCPPWMKVLVRDEDDPLTIKEHGKGILNVIDLANKYSCSFIATDDVGIVYEDGSFEVKGRLDNSDIRGCSLLVV